MDKAIVFTIYFLMSTISNAVRKDFGITVNRIHYDVIRNIPRNRCMCWNANYASIQIDENTNETGCVCTSNPPSLMTLFAIQDGYPKCHVTTLESGIIRGDRLLIF